ncbi:MAG: hypothetical protein AAB459_00235 [Patescibacteria group bacterium]
MINLSLILAIFNSISPQIATASSNPKLNKVFRLNNVSGKNDQLLTTSRNKADQLVATNSWVEQQINWSDTSINDNKSWVYDRIIPGTLPLYCLYNSSQSIHFITSDLNQRNSLLSNPNWINFIGCGTDIYGNETSILGYSFREKSPGAGAIYQLYKPSYNSGSNVPNDSSIVITTMIKSTADSLVANYGYQFYGSGIKTPYNLQAPSGNIGYLLRYEHVDTSSSNIDQPYYEIGYPSGEFINKYPKGLMILVHGGGWVNGDNPGLVLQPLMRNEAIWWNNQGWQTINIDYHPGRKALDSVKSTYSKIKYWRPQLSKCIWGSSAGAQLSMLTAASNSDIKCVISHGGPLDLPTLQAGSVKNAAAMVFCTPGTDLDDQGCLDQLASVSPARIASNINARILIAANKFDSIVSDPVQQLDSFNQARVGRQNWTARLNTGTLLYTHKNIDSVSKNLIHDTNNGLQKKLVDCVLGVTGSTNCNSNVVFTP